MLERIELAMWSEVMRAQIRAEALDKGRAAVAREMGISRAQMTRFLDDGGYANVSTWPKMEAWDRKREHSTPISPGTVALGLLLEEYPVRLRRRLRLEIIEAMMNVHFYFGWKMPPWAVHPILLEGYLPRFDLVGESTYVIDRDTAAEEPFLIRSWFEPR